MTCIYITILKESIDVKWECQVTGIDTRLPTISGVLLLLLTFVQAFPSIL